MDIFDFYNRFSLRHLPRDAVILVEATNAPPRLIVHLVLVHDVAHQLVDSLFKAWPGLRLDVHAVLFGAAVHDIGKVLHPEELIGPGHQHERAGRALLCELGLAPQLARFAETHASWHGATIEIEDLLVALADTCWKGKRDTELEQALTTRIVELTGAGFWEVYLALDDLIERIAAAARPALRGKLNSHPSASDCRLLVQPSSCTTREVLTQFHQILPCFIALWWPKFQSESLLKIITGEIPVPLSMVEETTPKVRPWIRRPNFERTRVIHDCPSCLTQVLEAHSQLLVRF